jgi:hypothetical protein
MITHGEKFCKNTACGKLLRKGRTDMKFCNAKCRSAHYQHLNKDSINAAKSFTRGNRNNEKVLRLLYERLPKSEKYPKYVDISMETLIGAGYDKEFLGLVKITEWGSKKTNAYQYYRFVLIAHPDQTNRFLITILHENT